MVSKRVTKALRLLAVWMLLLAVGLWIAHRRYRRAIDPPSFGRFSSFAEGSRDTGLPESLLRSVGFFNAERLGLRSLRPEHPGRVRIAAIGDSFTFGDEVVSGLDYPSRLSKRIEQLGLSNVEVVNFGSPGLGFSEAFRVWDEVASRYHPDFVLLGPLCMLEDRDESFHWAPPFAASVHGRFILDGDGVRFVDVVGAGVRERYEAIHRLVPRLDYLRYDRKPPDFIQAFLPPGKTVRNPFYYSRLDPKAERDQLYERMLRRMTEGGAQVVLAHFDPEIAAIGARLGDRMATLQVPFPTGAIFRRPRGHLSGAGNDLIARVFLQLLLGTQPVTLEGAEVTPITDAPASTTVRLETFERVDLEWEGQAAARLMVPGGAEPDANLDPKALGSRSLLALAPPTDFLAAVFLPLSQVPRAGARVALKIGERMVYLGTLRPLGGLPVWSVRLPKPLGTRGAGLDDEDNGPAVHGVVLIDDQAVAEIVGTGDRLELRPRIGKAAILAPFASDYLDLTRLPERGAISLKLSGAPTVTTAIARFERTHPVARFDGAMGRRLQPSVAHPGVAEIVEAGRSP